MSVRAPSRVPTRVAVVAAVVAVGALGMAGSANAHVTITPSTTAAGEPAILTVSVEHGCEGSATTELTVQVPEGVGSVIPVRHPLWEVSTETVALDPPVTDSHGNQVSERVATVTYRSNTPLPDGVRDAVELSLRLPDDEGATLAFPTVQRCEQGESAWIEVPASGQSADDLALPAPVLTVTAAGASGTGGHGAGGHGAGGHGADTGAPAVPVAAAAAGPPGGDDGGGPLVGVALGAGLLGAVLGGAAFVQTRRRS